MTTVLLVIVGVLLVVALHDVVRRPLLRRQALRNLVRRPSETAIVIGGALLGTAIITASFVIGDTIDSSIRSIARTNMGQIDEGVVVDDATRTDDIASLIESPPIDGVDGVLTSSTVGVVVSASAADGSLRAEPSARTYELDFDAARAFGSSPADSGLADAGPTPGDGQVAVSQKLADTLDVDTGDMVTVHVYGQDHPLEVIEVLPHLGLAGRAGENVHVAPGTLGAWFDAAADPSFDGPVGLVYVSNDGGVFDGADLTSQVLPELERRVGGIDGVEVGDWKRDLLEDAEAEGTELTTVFSSIGAFAVISGILLVVNIVIMLTEERRTQLGILRALGLKRNQLVRTMGLEGTGYAVLATPIGVALGVVVGWLVGLLARSLVAGDGLDLRFAMDTSSLVTSAAIGLLITLVTVWVASIRLARLNVIAAIRDLPDNGDRERRWWRTLLAGGVAAAGVGLLALGVSGESPIPALIGVPIAAFGLGPLLGRAIGRRLATSAASVVALSWGVLVFSILPDTMAAPDIDVFVAQGVVLVGAAVTLLTVNSSAWRLLIAAVGAGARGVPVRLGLTYPLAKRGRTAMLLGMYSLVIFTITFMAVMVAVFDSQSGDLADQAGGGYDIIVDANPTNPPTVDDYLRIDGVSSAAALSRAWADIGFGGAIDDFPVTGVGQDFLTHGGPELSSFDQSYSSELDAWRDVLARDDRAIVGEFLFEDQGPVLEVGSELQIFDEDGRAHTVTVAGVLANDWIWNGVFVADDVARDLTDNRGPAWRHYLQAGDGVAPEVLASQINGELLTTGVDARSFDAEIDDELANQQGFIRILQGYLGLGLLIGVAGLGIVLVRAVRERRREIGMLRAMGYRSTTVKRAFLVEALFIAGQGAVVGVALGLVSSWQVVTRSDSFGAGSPDFVVPVLVVAIVGLGPVLASLLAALGPAKRAAAIDPAVALRVTG